MRDRFTAARVGAKVLDGLAKGRQRAIAQAQERGARLQMLVIIAANADRNAGKPARGLAGRIARKLCGMISERHCKRILDSLSSMSESLGQNEAHIHTTGGSHE